MIVRGKPEDEKYLELLAHHDGESYELFVEIPCKYRMLDEYAKDFSTVEKAFMDRFVKIPYPGDVIHVMDAKLDPK